jgi:hypothetical protein
LHETVAAFELTVSRITEIAVTRSGKADRDLVVALQDFDRLQQEFATLGQVLHRLSNRPAAEGVPQDVGHEEVIAEISIADLKHRLSHHLRMLTTDIPEIVEEDVEF